MPDSPLDTPSQPVLNFHCGCAWPKGAALGTSLRHAYSPYESGARFPPLRAAPHIDIHTIYMHNSGMAKRNGHTPRRLSIEYVPLSSIRRLPRNAKDHDIGSIISSYEQFGVLDPLAVNDITGHDFDGNGRADALQAMKAGGKSVPLGVLVKGNEWHVPVVRGIALSKRDEERAALALNRTNELGGYDDRVLAETLADLAAQERALLEGTGYDTSDLDEILRRLGANENADAEPQFDRAKELQKKWGTNHGQLWELPTRNGEGAHRLLCGNSEKVITKFIQKTKLDAVITDPPYGIEIVRGLSAAIGGAKSFGRVRQRGGRAQGVLGKVERPGIIEPRLYHPVYGDDRPFEPAWLLELAPVIILFGANHYASRLPDSPAWIVWDKGVSPDSTFSACELIWTNKGNHVRRYEWRWSGMIRKGDREFEMKDRIHPTQKPVGLLIEFIQDYTNEGDWILDPYLGSGTTMIAAENSGRLCLGGEYDEGYVAVSLQRYLDVFGIDPHLIESSNGKAKRKRNPRQ